MNGGAAVKYIGIALLIAAGFVLLTLGLAFLLFRLAFGARKTTEKEMFVLPDTDQYRPYAAEARRMIRAALALPYEPVTIRSDDGLTLFGRCYPAAVSRGQWERIAARSRDEADWRAVIDEAAPWAEASFARHGVISILGL